MSNNTDTIIWDWNGTLLDDVDICVDSISVLLRKRNLPEITLEYYREVFTFPVRDYYERIGFDFNMEPYDKVAFEFMDVYLQRLLAAGLFAGVIPVLNYCRSLGFRQAVLSAMEQETLEHSIQAKGIRSYFDIVVGIQNHFADGKLENAERIIRELNADKARTMIIGDTLHDHEVAGRIGCECLLFSGGHQSAARLATSGRRVIASHAGLILLLNGIEPH